MDGFDRMTAVDGGCDGSGWVMLVEVLVTVGGFKSSRMDEVNGDGMWLSISVNARMVAFDRVKDGLNLEVNSSWERIDTSSRRDLEMQMLDNSRFRNN